MNIFIVTLFTLSILFEPISLEPVNLGTRRSEDDNNKPREEEIARLEREREALFSKISNGIDESVKHLMRSNDSDAKEGIELVTALKKQLELLNDNTENIDPLKSRRESFENAEYFRRGSSYVDLFRRENDEQIKPGSGERKPKVDIDGKKNDDGQENDNEKQIDDAKKHDERNKNVEPNGEIKPRALDVPELRSKKKKKADVFDDKLFDDRYRSNRTRERYKDRGKMRDRVEQWLKKKAAEMAAIKEYQRKQLPNDTVRELSAKEPCPREGIHMLKKYTRGSSNYKGLRGLKGYYPCCRKCCKRSYLGCL